jgi:hypothetical protein
MITPHKSIILLIGGSNMEKHKVFISFKYTEDHYYKDKLVELSEKYGTFFDYSVGEGEISGTLSDEQIRRKIRDEFIKDATVTILLIGKNMNQSKFIDWEVHASMYDSEKNPKMGIVCINLPEIDDKMLDFNDIISDNAACADIKWTPALEELERQPELHPNAPHRIVENLMRSNVRIPIINWNALFGGGEENASNLLQKLVDCAHNIRKEQSYDISAPLRRHSNNR